MDILIIIGIVVTVAVFSFFGFYQSLKKNRTRVLKARDRVYKLLEHRSMLIPELADSVKGLAVQTDAGLAEVLHWQHLSSQAHNTTEATEANIWLKKALSRFFNDSKQYPELNANARFLRLQGDIGFLEEQLDQFKHEYNEEAIHFNKMICLFPYNLFAPFYKIREEMTMK